MDHLDGSLTSSPLPSLSPLTGTFRPSTAAPYLEASWNQLNRKPNRSWGNGCLQPPKTANIHKSQADVSEVGLLRNAASQHVSALKQNFGLPYRKVLNPQEKAAADEKRAQQKQLVHHLLQGLYQQQQHQQQGLPSQAGRLQTPDAKQQTEQQVDVAAGNDVPNSPQRCSSPARIVQELKKQLLPSRPSTSLSVQDVSFSTPMATRRIHTADSRHPVSASWSGPLLETNIRSNDADQGCSPLTSPTSLLCKSPLTRRSPAAPLLTAPCEPWNTSSQPCSSNELNKHTHNHPSSTLPTGVLPQQSNAEQAPTQPGSLLMPGAAAKNIEAMVLAATERPPPPRWGPGQPLHHFKPTRGLMYSVFSELDPADTGKMSFSQFEEACVACGLKPEQTARLFCTLDAQGKGYFTVRDWGSKEHEKQVMDFTRLYVQTTRGATGKPLGVKEIKSVALAVQIALHRLQIKNHGRVVSQERLMRAFDFLDVDGSGALSLDEVQDGFNAMGIYVTPDVLREIIQKFDTNRNGVIEYREFLGALFPVLSKAF